MKTQIASLDVSKALLLGLIIGCALPAALAERNQEESGAARQSKELKDLIYSVKGPNLFQAYCASCHGVNGKGGGPAAPALKTPPPDLTLLSKRKGGQFPRTRVRDMISGDEVVASHGSREMPIWGPVFHRVEEDRDFGSVRIENLVKYLESIQSAADSQAPSGAELYRQDCAVCHGSDLKGGGSVPFPYRVPPDLTTLARRHGGKFSRSYVSQVLQSGIAMPAHGPAEMPIWGADFRLSGQLNDAQVASRIAALVDYIECHQRE